MGLFLHETTAVSAPPRACTSALAVWSLLLAATGFLNVIGFLAGPALAMVALARLRAAKASGNPARGRRLAIAAIWLSGLAVAVGVLALIAILVVAYAQMPEPPTISHFHFF